MALNEYPAGAAFSGVIGRTTDESSPAWPQPSRPVPGSPNVLMIVLDDTGFGQLGCYGSPIATPNFDALAANGLRYNNMHTTALCSPSRSCIVTGRNHHSNGMAAITELASGYPGYNGIVPFENGFLSEMLLGHGYSTYMVGKWHLTPSNHETAAGPTTAGRWRAASSASTFLGGDTSQWYPELVYDNHQVGAPERAITSPRTWSTSPCSSSRTPSRSTRTSPSTSTSASVPHTLPPCGQGMGGQVRGAVRRRLGRLPGQGVRRSEEAGNRPPAAPSSPGTTPTSRSGTRYPSRHASCSAA